MGVGADEVEGGARPLVCRRRGQALLLLDGDPGRPGGNLAPHHQLLPQSLPHPPNPNSSPRTRKPPASPLIPAVAEVRKHIIGDPESDGSITSSSASTNSSNRSRRSVDQPRLDENAMAVEASEEAETDRFFLHCRRRV